MPQQLISKNLLSRIIIVVVLTAVFSSSLSVPMNALTVISPIVELSGKPGSGLRGVVKVFNESNESITLISSVEAFTINDQGQPVYIQRDPDNFTDWFNLEQPSLTLQPRQVAIVPFDVVIPRAATPGGYYATIFWQTDNQGNMPVTVNAKVGTVVLLTVEGEVRSKVSISSFSMEPSGGVVWGGPVQFNAQLSNSGNIHAIVQGNIMIQSWGRNATLLLPANNIVLPDARRQVSVGWLGSMDHSSRRWFATAIQEFKAGIFGPTNATIIVQNGVDNFEEQTISFWFIPIHAIAVTAGSVVLCIILLVINRRMNRLKKRVLRIHDEPS